MASLRNIMNNVDDDAQPRSSSSRPVPHSSSLPNASYPASSDLSMHNHPSPSEYSRGASPHSAYSHTSESSTTRHLQHHLPPPGGRRESGGNEPVGFSYSHGQSYGAGPDMRPMMPAGTMGEPGVKLTPITGRVSRAKKGVPVHTCEICRPPKTFSRAEHLRRHQLSHKPPDLTCSVPGCNKAFHRKDLLERHQQRHEQDEQLASDDPRLHESSPRRRGQSFGSSSPSRAMQMGSYGAPNSAHSPISSTPRHETSGHSNWSSANRSFGHSLPPPRISASPQQYYAQSPQSRYSADSTSPSQEASPPSDAHHILNPPESAGHKTPEAGPDFYMSDGDQSNSTDIASSATGSTYSTPSDTSNDRLRSAGSSNTDLKFAAAKFTASLDAYFSAGRSLTSSYEFSLAESSTGFSMPKQSTGVGFPLSGYDEESVLIAEPLLANTAMRALTMPIGVGRSTDVLMAAPAAVLQDRMMLPQHSVLSSDIAFMAHSAMQGTPSLALSQSVHDAVPVYLEVYWNKVHPMYPIIHRYTFEKALESASDTADLLQCAMAAASSIEPWPIETMQAVLLSEYYMRFRGREKDAFQTSELFKHLYQEVNSKVTLPQETTIFGRPDTWEAWVEDETHRRLLASCFLLDVHCMRYFERAPVSVPGLDYSSPSTLAIPLSANTTKLWEATAMKSWSKLNPQCPRLSVALAITQGYKSLDIQESSPFDASVLLAAYSLQFPSRQNPTRLDLIQDLSGVDMSQINVLNLFAHSAVANAYLALHFTPLHVVLSITGDSWVFNKKVLRLSAFAQQQSQLSRWRDSGSSAAAATFAARALVAFLGLGSDGSRIAAVTSSPCYDISDFWGIYVCALICWAFGHVGKDGSDAWNDVSSRPAALQWLQNAAKMQPAQVQRLGGRRNARAVVGLAREALEREHLGGRSILLADAIGVLRKLDDRNSCKRF
ncbi:Transcription factor [Beauveria brongniartii RCEF 3172]|uniref:Transcription factor n=1 Tax=Beauveria brongniartii RCEF 3172 TaxID=1081107 RepID=A0A166ZJL8_9HYPO|nr:Transcription factor [Beauveria brongniartii RCEF 3172]